MHGMCNDMVQLAILKKSTKSKSGFDPEKMVAKNLITPFSNIVEIIFDF